MEVFDVAVVGAGPAGTSTAIEALQRDPSMSVVLLEGIRRANTLLPAEPGAGHSMCSGGLGRAMVDIIGWPIPDEVRQAEIHRVILRGPRRSLEVSGSGLGIDGPLIYVINRKRFDDWLLSKARAAGATYEQQARVVQTLPESVHGERVWKVSTRDGRTFRARSLVGADGPESRIAATHLGATPIRDRDMYLATEVYVPRDRFPHDAISVQFQTSRLQGYYWAFSAGPVVKVGCGASRAGSANVSQETTWWRGRLAEEYGDDSFLAPPLEYVGGRITGSPPLKHVADPQNRVAVVGEAARAVWASVGAGDASAVETGRALGRALAMRDLSRYQAWWRRRMYGFLRRHYRIKELTMGLSDTELDQLVEAVGRFRPKTTNVRLELPRLLALMVRRRPLLVGKVALRVAFG
jgi:digeranylgeranylglycerophospholipid reductase